MNNESSNFLYDNLTNSEEPIVENNQEPFTLRESLNVSYGSTNERPLFCGIRIKRRYLTRAVWSVIVFIILLVLIFGSFSAAVSTALVIVTLATLFNFLSMYITTNRNYFSLDGYISVVVSYSIIAIKLIIVIFDLSYNGLGKKETSKSTILNSFIYYTWMIVYWISLIFNFGIILFQQVFWKQGHPRFLGRLWQTIKYLKWFLIIGGIGLVLLIILISILASYAVLDKGMEWYTKVSVSVELGNILFCEIIFVILYGIGLVYFPMKFLRYTSSIDNLKKVIKDFVKFKSSYELSVNKFDRNSKYLIKVAKKVRNVYDCPKDLEQYCNTIIENLERKNKNNFVNFNDFIEYNINVYDDFGEMRGPDYVKEYPIDVLSQMYMKVQTYYYLCIKKKTVLIDAYLTIRNNAQTFGEKTIFYQNDKMKEQIHKKNVYAGTKNYLVIPKEHKMYIQIITKIIGGVLFIISVLLYGTQIFMLIVTCLKDESTLDALNKWFEFENPSIFILLYFAYFAFIILSSFYSLTRVRKIDDYIIVVHQCDKFTMIKNSSMTNKILLGIIYNFLFFSINLDPSMQTDQDKTNQLAYYFKALKDFTVIKKIYGIGFPILLTIVIIFAVLSQYGYNFDKIFNILFKRKDEVELKLKKERREKYKNGKFLKKESIAYLSDENMLFIIERFEKEFLEEISTI